VSENDPIKSSASEESSQSANENMMKSNAVQDSATKAPNTDKNNSLFDSNSEAGNLSVPVKKVDEEIKAIVDEEIKVIDEEIKAIDDELKTANKELKESKGSSSKKTKSRQSPVPQTSQTNLEDSAEISSKTPTHSDSTSVPDQVVESNLPKKEKSKDKKGSDTESTNDSQSTIPIEDDRANDFTESESIKTSLESQSPQISNYFENFICDNESFSLNLLRKNIDRRSILNLRPCSKKLRDFFDNHYFRLVVKFYMAQSTKENIKKNIDKYQALLYGVHFDCRDPPLEALTPLLPQSLKKLNLSYCKNISEIVLKSIPNQLLILDLSHCEWKESHSSHLPSTIQTLLLRSTDVSDTALENMSHLKQLKHLDLSFCKSVTSKGLTFLNDSITQLILRGCVLLNGESFDCHDISKKFPLLQYLDLTWCTKLTELWYNQFKSKYPNIDIKYCNISPPPAPDPVESNSNQRPRRFLRAKPDAANSTPKENSEGDQES